MGYNVSFPSISDMFYLPFLKQADEMIVSVTGATGFIGKRLVQRLHAGIYAQSISVISQLIYCNGDFQ